jgi:hypothetical protein
VARPEIPLPISGFAVPWLPSLGVLLAGLGGPLVWLGFSALLLHASSSPVAIPAETTNQLVAAPIAAEQDAEADTVDRRRFTIVGGQTTTDQRSASATTQEHIGGDPIAAAICLSRDSARGTRAESAHLATNPFCRDLSDALTVMAQAAEHRGGLTNFCPCPLDVPSDRSRQVTSDDRIANALFSPGVEVRPQDPPAAWDARWDLFVMAHAQRNDGTWRCPCPVYPVEHPRKGPR